MNLTKKRKKMFFITSFLFFKKVTASLEKKIKDFNILGLKS